MTFKPFLPFIFFVCLCACKNNPAADADDQAHYDCQTSLSAFQSVDSLVGVMQGVDPWGEDASLDSIADLNTEIENRLTALLQCGAVETLPLDQAAFQHLNYAQSPDGRIRNFHWYANNGGTWQEMRRLYQYYPQPNVAKASRMDYLAGATRFFLLKADQPLYLGLGVDKTCSTCLVEYADLFTFRADTLHTENIISLEYRMGNLIEFEFDPATQSIRYVLVVDDLNEEMTANMPKKKFNSLGIKLDKEYEGFEPEPDADVVTGTLVFDGQRFVKKED